MLGATPHEFESRILRQCLTGHDVEGPHREVGPFFVVGARHSLQRAYGLREPGNPGSVPGFPPCDRTARSVTQLTRTFRSTVTWSMSVVRTVVFMVQVPASGRVRVSEVQ